MRKKMGFAGDFATVITFKPYWQRHQHPFCKPATAIFPFSE
jgi:hypothetical protein